MMLYLHRVKGLVLALLTDPRFLSDEASMEEVVRHPADNWHFFQCLVTFSY